MKYYAVVPAAGVGSRMGAEIPKQYLRIHGRMVIDWSIAVLLEQPAIESIVVALGENDCFWDDTQSAAETRVKTVSGGQERCYSVLNALEYLSQQGAENDWVLVHDAARPCLTDLDLSRLMQLHEKTQGGLLGVPVHDTMKRTDSDARVMETIGRNNLWHAQTPQMFHLGDLRRALGEALRAGVLVTDEASAMEWAGYYPQMVEGSPSNIKITRRDDLKLAEFYLAD